ncbi:MAG: hypothetical protein ACRDK7_11970 [Solirubrobacteraceae bacterium]
MSASTTDVRLCERCDERPAAFDVGLPGFAFVLCESCAKRDGLVDRGKAWAALDMLELGRLNPMGGEVLEAEGRMMLGDPREWQRGYVALNQEGDAA